MSCVAHFTFLPDELRWNETWVGGLGGDDQFSLRGNHYLLVHWQQCKNPNASAVSFDALPACINTHEPNKQNSSSNENSTLIDPLRDTPVDVSDAPEGFLVTLAPGGIGVLEPEGVRMIAYIQNVDKYNPTHLDARPLAGLIRPDPVGVLGRLPGVPFTGTVSLRAELLALERGKVELAGVTRLWCTGIRLGVPSKPVSRVLLTWSERRTYGSGSLPQWASERALVVTERIRGSSPAREGGAACRGISATRHGDATNASLPHLQNTVYTPVKLTLETRVSGTNCCRSSIVTTTTARQGNKERQHVVPLVARLTNT
uniref:Uncharacterized protein n=1 Tax=Timema shepardi TaxID=629360 RepID=A0A7R9ARA8_TIMSH|nr:unnamed protein product [Timema shepardi]